MIVISLTWIFIFLSSFSFGLFSSNILGRLSGSKLTMPVAFTSVTGLISMTVILSYCSLFISMNNSALQCIIAIITLISCWYYREAYTGVWQKIKNTWNQSNFLHKTFILVFLAFILIKASGQVQSL